MPAENVSVTEGLEVSQAPAVEVPAEAVLPDPGETRVRLRAGDPVYDAAAKAAKDAEDAREKALSGIPADGQPVAGGGS